MSCVDFMLMLSRLRNKSRIIRGEFDTVVLPMNSIGGCIRNLCLGSARLLLPECLRETEEEHDLGMPQEFLFFKSKYSPTTCICHATFAQRSGAIAGGEAGAQQPSETGRRRARRPPPKVDVFGEHDQRYVYGPINLWYAERDIVGRALSVTTMAVTFLYVRYSAILQA